MRFDWQRYATPNEKQAIALIDGLLKEARVFVLRLVNKRQRVIKQIRTRVK